MASENAPGSGSQRNRPPSPGPTGNDPELSDSQPLPPQPTSTELILNSELVLGTELALNTGLVAEPSNLGDNSAQRQPEQINTSRRAGIRQQPQPAGIDTGRDTEPLTVGTFSVRADTNLASRREHDRAGVGSGMPLPPLPAPVASPGSRTGPQHHAQPRSIYSPRSQRSDPFSDSPTSRTSPRRSPGSPLAQSPEALPQDVPLSIAETHVHGSGAPRFQQGSSRNNSAPRPRLQKQESERDILIDQLLRQNEQYRAELVGLQFGNDFADDDANEDNPEDDPGDLDDDLEAQRSRRNRQQPRNLRTVNLEGPVPIISREDIVQGRTPATDDAGTLGAQAAGEILYSITRVNNTQPDQGQSTTNRRGVSDGVKRSRTTVPRFSTARSFIDDLVPLRPPSSSGSNRRLENDPATYMAGSISSRLSATLHDAESERDKYAHKAKYTGWALNIAIGLQVLLGSLTTGLSAVATRGKSAAVATTILGALATLVASYLARARGSNEPELSITRVKDLEQFIRECRNFEKDYGEDMTNKHQPVVDRFRDRFESLLGNANGERKLSASGGAFQRDVTVGHY